MTVTSTIRTLAMAAAVMLTPVVASADTISFNAAQGSNGSPLVLPEATLTNDSGGQILVGPGAAGQVDGFCFLGAGCAADGTIDFSSAVTGLTFDVDGAQSGDSVLISAYDGATLLTSLTMTANGLVDFSAFGSITRLVFDDSSTAAGVGYSTFNFTPAATAVPAPAALPLFGIGLLGLGFVSRRRAA